MNRVVKPDQDFKITQSHLKFNLKIKLEFNLKTQQNKQEIIEISDQLQATYIKGYTEAFFDAIENQTLTIKRFFLESSKQDCSAALHLFGKINKIDNLTQEQVELKKSAKKMIKHFDKVGSFIKKILNK
ncbi:hypothetical protein OXYTRIMIC_296 [Oxytricha trifallax]|uniref:Uncharacterized protein n=1 Tax=Oxytricha trifallax TaxID=1172189 RepID=A0A073IAS5_9SPIT|nr:hypothetical protein OXYTRIMIC_296 [Oxytricha trifallax]